MIRYFISFAFIILAAGCQTVSRQQRAAVSRFADRTIDLSSSPKAILEELSAIRESRGIYYAASLTDPVLHLSELDNVIGERAFDEKLTGQAGMAFRVLENYAQGLKTLADDQSFQKMEEGYARFGRDLEKLVSAYNETGSAVKIPEGIGLLFSKSAGFSTKSILAKRQAKTLRKFVVKADTLVAAVCFEMARVLSPAGMGRLIEAEKTGLTESFRFYYARETPCTTVPDRDYVALRKRIDQAGVLREKALKASSQLRTAHKKLAEEVFEKRKATELADELVDYYKEAEEISRLIKKL